MSLPDNLTRYRIMAVAVDGADHFGKGESTITARLPLQVRPSAPRFLNFGDRFELPVVIQNQTDEPLEVDVALQVANLAITGPAGKRVTVPANNRIEVRFPARTDQVGTARFRVVTVSGDHADAAEVELPVYTPATAEAFATYGVIDEGSVLQPLLAPTGVFPQFGGLEIGTSSTALQALTDAVLYLVEYRYESADGFASRIMAVAALRDVLDAFDADGLPDPAELDRQVNRDITRLSALQNDDGGFPYWQRGRESIPWQSIQSTHALVLAKAAGYTVATDTLNRALDHLADIEEYYPAEYGDAVRNSLSSYALYVRNEAGNGDVAKATDLYRFVGDDLELDAVAWLWPSIVDEQLRGRDRASVRQRCRRDRRGRHVRDQLRRGRLRDRQQRSQDRRHHPRRVDHRDPRQRPDHQGRHRVARQPDTRPLEQRPRERLHPAGPESVLRHVRDRSPPTSSPGSGWAICTPPNIHSSSAPRIGQRRWFR